MQSVQTLRVLAGIALLLLTATTAWGQETITVAGVEPDDDGEFTDISNVTYDATNKILTLDGATITGSITWNMNATLTIKLIGDCSINSCNGTACISSSNTGNLTIRNEESGPASLSLNTGNDVTSVISGFFTLSYVGLDDGFNTYEYSSNDALPVKYEAASGLITDDQEGNPVASVRFKNYYDLSIAGVQVTIANKDDILEDGGSVKFSYDAETYTITLSGATILGSIEWVDDNDLTIALNGTNSVINKDGSFAIYSVGEIKFVKAEGAESAELEAQAGFETAISFLTPYKGGIIVQKADHRGHRARMKKKLKEQGMDVFEPHEVLEIMLYYAIPQRNTNDIAKNLIDRFGSFSAVLDAPIDMLCRAGLTEHQALYLKMIPDVTRLYMLDKYSNADKVLDSERFVSYIIDKFVGYEETEHVLLLLMDAKGKEIYSGMIAHGDFLAANISIREIVTLALNYGAASAILAHSHPSGFALPSQEDVLTTQAVQQALSLVNVMLVDHFIIADHDCVSLAESGII